MKRLGFLLLAVLALAAVSNAGVLSGSTYGVVYEKADLFDTISTATAYCTLTTSNTKTIWEGKRKMTGSKQGLEPGWEYILVHDTLTGSTASSGVIEIVLQTLNDDNYVLQTTIVDSITGAAEQYGGSHLIPFWEKLVGHKYKIILQGDTGAQNIFNRMYIYRRKPVIYMNK